MQNTDMLVKEVATRVARSKDDALEPSDKDAVFKKAVRDALAHMQKLQQE